MFSFSWNPEMFAVSLPIMAKGMVGIFAVICAIWGFAALLNRVTGRHGADDAAQLKFAA